MSILLAALLFGILIFVHELGHFIFAKLCNVKVLKFSLGFGPRLIGKTIGETEYVVSAVPLGGYVKMYGEDVEDEISEQEKERSFKSQALWKKALIVLAGPFFNIVLTFGLYTSLLAAGIEVPVPDLKNLMPVVDEVDQNYPAAAAGMRAGDRILKIGDTDINTWFDIINIVATSPGKPLKIVVKRDNALLDFTITPATVQEKDRSGKPITIGRIGIKKNARGLYSLIKSDSLLDSPLQGAFATYKMGTMIFDSLRMTVSGEISYKNLGGPIAIFSESNKAASAGAITYFLFMALVSVNLGVLNLLPIPVLDGGHLLFMAIEAVKGKPVSDTAIAVSQRIGIAILIALMILVMYNDIFRLLMQKGTP
ncbi:MAG TPA: RIP metalloprotease RseP [Dissulfurispiraceae bacterium]|nr:RIP metalloprotease RseP [Dissulfurispiraceae bacterium]